MSMTGGSRGGLNAERGSVRGARELAHGLTYGETLGEVTGTGSSMSRWSSAALVLLAVAAAGVLAAGCATAPDKLGYIVVPHPDDEMQAWPLIEDTPDTYKVFIMLTRGEQTAYCNGRGYDQGSGEAEPHPWPAGKWTSSCEKARQNSFFRFIAGMAEIDSGLPREFSFEGVKGPFDSLGHSICRLDDGDCVTDLTAEVWTSPLGAVVWFNLGDGDLSKEEAEWAITTVRDNRAALGIDSSLPSHSLIGASYSNPGFDGCFLYDHPDHWAVQLALWTTDYGVGQQTAPSCRNDPVVSRHEQVSMKAFDAAFEVAETTRVGTHVVFYGWLFSDEPGYWPGDYDGQDELFHRHQSFWVQYGDS